MALSAGQPLCYVWNLRAMPPHGPFLLVAAGPMMGLGHPARVAKDGTRWCAYCERTLDPRTRQEHCRACESFRDRLRHGPAAYTFRSLPTELINGLLAQARYAQHTLSRDTALFAVNGRLTSDDLRNLNEALATLFAITDLTAEYLESQYGVTDRERARLQEAAREPLPTRKRRSA